MVFVGLSRPGGDEIERMFYSVISVAGPRAGYNPSKAAIKIKILPLAAKHLVLASAATRSKPCFAGPTMQIMHCSARLTGLGVNQSPARGGFWLKQLSPHPALFAAFPSACPCKKKRGFRFAAGKAENGFSSMSSCLRSRQMRCLSRKALHISGILISPKLPPGSTLKLLPPPCGHRRNDRN